MARENEAKLPKVDDATLELRIGQVERCVEAMREGKSLHAFCREEHVAPATLTAWAERLGVELDVARRQGAEGAWVSVELGEGDLAAVRDPAPIEVEIKGALARIPAGCAREDVECVLTCLAALP